MTTPATTPIRVLLVEDNPGDARLIIEMLRDVSSQEFDLERVDRLEPALSRLSQAGADVVLLDLGLPDSSGLETFERTQRGGQNEPIVVISGLDDERLALEAVRAGAQDYLVKGRIEGELLARVIRYAIERKHAEQTLREREERFRQLVENMSEVFFVVDVHFQEALYLSPAFERVWGQSRSTVYARATAFLDPVMAEDRALLLAAMGEVQLGRDPGSIEFRLTRPDGDVRAILAHAVPVRDPAGNVYRIAGVALDISDRKRAEEALRASITERASLERQLQQAQKMEAIGRLAGGVAHDFNNLLTAIFGYAEFASAELPAGSPVREDIEEIRKAAQRASGLTRQLLAFSRQQVLEPVVLNINDLVDDIDKMLRRLIGEDVELRVSLSPALGNVRADAGQLQQVLMNLAVNSRDAMPTGGRLLIETANAELTEQYAEQHQPVVPGRYVMLAVSDTGIGMSAATKARIFEPFFTTKEKGKGTGLGLSTVYGIVKQSGGYVWAYSEEGRGTTFKIYLPQVDAAVEEAPPRREPETLTGTETVLVAEDDELLRPLARAALEKLGYTVLAADAPQAIAAAREHAGTIHLLITDVVMPGMSGRDLARELAPLRPAMRVLYVSGYTDEAIVHHGMLDPGLHFLQKPFTPASLARKVRSVLESP